ncbi:MerR family transcriptional regulator [Paenibacillaceae bacterium]|nr:MerR family transcriptional regulator [Paenibacillaceae bacterium]
MKKTWKIGELAKLTGLTIRTLQYYDQIGLYRPSGHSSSKNRLYTEGDILKLQHVLSLREIGLSLEQIKATLKGDQISLHEIMTLQIAKLKDNIINQQNRLHKLEAMAKLVDQTESLTVEHYTHLLGLMRMMHVEERSAHLGKCLDQLGVYLHSRSNNL